MLKVKKGGTIDNMWVWHIKVDHTSSYKGIQARILSRFH